MNKKLIHCDILHLLLKEECEAVVMYIDRVVKIAIISIVLLGRYTRLLSTCIIYILYTLYAQIVVYN
jgi:hypothetical protein